MADATQDTFLLVAPRLDQLRDPRRLRPWRYAIARSEALRRIRARSRFSSEAEVTAMADPGRGPGWRAPNSARRWEPAPAHAYVLLHRLRQQVERSLGALLVARLGCKDRTELETLLSGWDGRSHR